MDTRGGPQPTGRGNRPRWLALWRFPESRHRRKPRCACGKNRTRNLDSLTLSVRPADRVTPSGYSGKYLIAAAGSSGYFMAENHGDGRPEVVSGGTFRGGSVRCYHRDLFPRRVLISRDAGRG